MSEPNHVPIRVPTQITYKELSRKPQRVKLPYQSSVFFLLPLFSHHLFWFLSETSPGKSYFLCFRMFTASHNFLFCQFHCFPFQLYPLLLPTWIVNGLSLIVLYFFQLFLLFLVHWLFFTLSSVFPSLSFLERHCRQSKDLGLKHTLVDPRLSQVTGCMTLTRCTFKPETLLQYQKWEVTTAMM